MTSHDITSLADITVHYYIEVLTKMFAIVQVYCIHSLDVNMWFNDYK